MTAISNIMLQKLMDSGSGTLFYVIITLLLLVVSLLRGKKKAQSGNFQSKGQAVSQKSNQASSSPKEWGLDSFLSSMINENIPPTSRVPEPELNEEDTELHFDDTEEPKIEPAIKEGVSAFPQDNPNTARIETELLENLQTSQKTYDSGNNFTYDTDKAPRENYLSNLLMEFNGKKAVIFSEILNPKYF